jgi:hypothetical protein
MKPRSFILFYCLILKTCLCDEFQYNQIDEFLKPKSSKVKHPHKGQLDYIDQELPNNNNANNKTR